MSEPRPLDRRDAIWIAAMIVVGVVVHRAAMFVGPFSDDYIQHAMVTGQYPGDYAPWDLYRLFDDAPTVRAEHLAQGLVPWWTAPDLHGSMLRPGPSLTLWLDHRVFARQPLVHHVHTMIWWALAIAAMGVVARRIFERPIAWTALAIFVVDPAAALPLAWHANRAVVIAAGLTFVAVAAHLRGRERGARHGMAWSTAAMVGAFAAGEYGYAAVAYVVGYEALARTDTWRERLRASGPAVAVAIVYFAVRGLGGYGTVGAEVYASPFTVPRGYLEQAWFRLPRLWADLFASLPSATWVFGARYDVVGEKLAQGAEHDAIAAHVKIAWVVLGGLALAAWLVRPGLEPATRRRVRWLLAVAIVGALPVAIAPSDGRLLLPLRLAADGCTAALIVGAIRLALASGTLGSRLRAALPVAAAGALVLQHGPYDAAFARESIRRVDEVAVGHRWLVLGPTVTGVDYGGRDVIVMASGTQTAMQHGALVADYHGHRVPRTWHVLSATRAPTFVERTGPRTIEVSMIRGESWLANRFDRSFCPRPRTLPTGTVVSAGVFVATILDDTEGRPTRVRFEFTRDLDDPHWVFLAPTGARVGMGLAPWRPPRIGGQGFVPLPRDAPATDVGSVARQQ